MKNLHYRILYILLAFLAIFPACTKNDDITSEKQNDSTATVELKLQVKDETGTKAESGLQNVSIWVYDMSLGLSGDRLPVAYKSVSSVNSSVRINIPVADTNKIFRLFAVANYQGLGEIYNVTTNVSSTEMVLNGNLTYNELTTAVFDANQTGGTSQSYPGADVTMPYTHWVDATLKANVSTGNASPTMLSMVLFRPVAKAELKAKISQEIPNKLFKIESVNIRPNLIAVPVQGALFSDITTAALDTLRTPSSFGNYSDFRVAISDNPLSNAHTNNYKSFEPVTITTASQSVGSTFLYENHHGKLYNAGTTADYTSAAGYDAGAYYMEINYSITPTGSDPASSETTTGVCYIPLPKIVRNNWYNVDATFNVDFAGNLILEYSVANWTQVKEELEFTYPTFTISAVATITEGSETVPDYSQPAMRYNSSFSNNATTAPTMAQGAFAFKFEMEPSTVYDREWTVHLKEYTLKNDEWTLDPSSEQTDDFTLVVCNKYDDNIIKDTNGNIKHTFIPSGIEYQIRVYPKKAKGTNVKAAKIYITYPASWLGGQSDELLINAGGGSTLWSDSGGERYAIFVIQGNDI